MTKADVNAEEVQSAAFRDAWQPPLRSPRKSARTLAFPCLHRQQLLPHLYTPLHPAHKLQATAFAHPQSQHFPHLHFLFYSPETCDPSTRSKTPAASFSSVANAPRPTSCCWEWCRPQTRLSHRSASLPDPHHPPLWKPSSNGSSQRRNCCRRRRSWTAWRPRKNGHSGARASASYCRLE